MVDEYHQKGWPLHVLLNNAGIQVCCLAAHHVAFVLLLSICKAIVYGRTDSVVHAPG